MTMRRREFITLLGGAAAWPLAARAQQPERMRRIGVLNPFGATDQAAQANITAFRQALQKLGWTEGRNVRSDYRWGGADAGRIRAQAIELVSLNPDVILASTSLALQPLQQETRSIPIVVVQITDPVGSGFVESLARPGGNGFHGGRVFDVRKIAGSAQGRDTARDACRRRSKSRPGAAVGDVARH